MNNKRLVKRWREEVHPVALYSFVTFRSEILGVWNLASEVKLQRALRGLVGPIIKRTALGRQQFLGNLSFHSYLQTIPK